MSTTSYDDSEEKAKDRELEVAAKLELEEWYAKYQERIANIKEQNRKDRETETNDNGTSGDNAALEWDHVVSLCGMKAPKNVKDVSRMKSILTKLKDCKA